VGPIPITRRQVVMPVLSEPKALNRLIIPLSGSRLADAGTRETTHDSLGRAIARLKAVIPYHGDSAFDRLAIPARAPRS